METLDLRTVVFSYTITSAVCAMGMGALWLQMHRRSAEVDFWLAGFVMQFLGVLMLALRGSVPDALSIVLADPLTIGGALTLYIGLELYTGKPGPQHHNYVLLVVFIAVHAYFTYQQPSLLARNLNLSLGLMLICSQCAWLMLHRVDAQMRPATRFVGITFVCYSLVSLAHIFGDLAAPPGDFFLDSGLQNTLVILAYQTLFIMLTTGLLLMRNRRLVDSLEMDILERKRVEGELRSLSIRDALTGLYNRHFFEEQAARLEGGRRYPVSVLMADVDGLKAVNDRQGHAAGDSLIERVGEVLRAAFRSEDIVARIGGDEFAVLLPNSDAAAAEAALCRVRLVLQDHNAAHAGAPVRLSFGVSTAGKRELLTAVLQRADENMYREKRAAAGARESSA